MAKLDTTVPKILISQDPHCRKLLENQKEDMAKQMENTRGWRKYFFDLMMKGENHDKR